MSARPSGSTRWRSTIEYWITFDSGKREEFRLAWAINDVPFYVRGTGERPARAVVLLDETFTTPRALRDRLHGIFRIAVSDLRSLPTARRDLDGRMDSAQLRVGLREYRIGPLTAVRVDWPRR